MSQTFCSAITMAYCHEHFIPKTKPTCPSNIKDFRSIACLNVEGKLFFSLISKQLVNHIITNNNPINTSVQKGCMDKVPGCWEHMSMVWSALKEARSARSSLANIWHDIASAYGSIPHRLLFFALERYGVDPHWISLIKMYYLAIYSRSFSQSAPSSWHQHFKGIFAGCALSIIVFLAGINVVIGYTLASSATGNVAVPLIRAFMDNLTLMSSSVFGAQNLLDRCVKALSWAGMSFRADKSRSIVIVRGKSMNTTPFYVTELSTPSYSTNCIPSIHSVPVKFHGRIVNGSLTNRNSIDELQEKLVLGLNTINKSSYKGTQKLWIL